MCIFCSEFVRCDTANCIKLRCLDVDTLTEALADVCRIFEHLTETELCLAGEMRNLQEHSQLMTARGGCFDVAFQAVRDGLRFLQTGRSRRNIPFTELNESSSGLHFAVFVKLIHKV